MHVAAQLLLQNQTGEAKEVGLALELSYPLVFVVTKIMDCFFAARIQLGK